MTQPKRVIVTSAPPNPNGDLHLGHLAGPFLGADVLTRYLRQSGHDVVHVGYADDFSCYVTRKASELDCPVGEVAHGYGKLMEQTLGLGNMSHDYFTHPLREPTHVDVVRKFFGELWQRGAFEVRELPTYWCDGCDRYLYEAEMRGLCQFCASPSDGVYCEECGRPQDTAGLREPKCTRCGAPEPDLRMVRRIVFPLENYRAQLREHYASQPLRPRLRAYLDEMLSRPLPQTAISRVDSYGIGVPLDDWQGNILDTWYCGIWGYVAATVAHAAACGRSGDGIAAWTTNKAQIVQFLGFDCSFSHAILWPALLMAHGGFTLPTHIVTNEFYRLEGDKFSTSRGHAIWGNELLRRVPADLLRFYLCLTGPERAYGNFVSKDFTHTVNEHLVGSLQGWLSAVFAHAGQAWGGRMPEVSPHGGTELADRLRSLPALMRDALEPAEYSPQRAAGHLLAVFHALPSATAELTEARSQDRAAHDGMLAMHLEMLATLATVAAPIMPTFSSEVARALRLPTAGTLVRTLPWPLTGTRMLPPGHVIDIGAPALFQPVDM